MLLEPIMTWPYLNFQIKITLSTWSSISCIKTKSLKKKPCGLWNQITTSLLSLLPICQNRYASKWTWRTVTLKYLSVKCFSDTCSCELFFFFCFLQREYEVVVFLVAWMVDVRLYKFANLMSLLYDNKSNLELFK